MASKKIYVEINGEEHVSEMTGRADQALGTFTDKVPGYAKVVAGMAAAYAVVQAAIGAVRDLVVDSFAAYDELATSQRKLEGTAKLTGLSLEYLQSIAAHGRKEFGLSRVTANEYATEVAKLAVKSGDASKATELLSGFLDIGAARGLSASESLQKASQAILGIDEGTDALFGANPSALWEQYAEVIGKSAGKFNDQEKAAALAYAVLEGGNKVVGSYATFLESAQGRQKALNESLQETKAALGEAMQPLRAFAIDSLSALVANGGHGVSAVGSMTQALVAFLAALRPIVQPVLTLGTVLLQVFSVGAEQIILSVRRLSGSTAIAVGSMIQSFGQLAERGGRFLRLLGIDVVADTGASMRKFGEEMVQVNQNKLLKVEYDALQFKGRNEKLWEQWRGNTTTSVDRAMTGVEESITSTTPKVAQAAGAMGKAVSDRLGEPMKVTIGLTEGAIRRLGDAARDQLPPETAEKFAEHMKTLAERAEESRLKMIGMKDEAGKGRDVTKKVAENMGDVAGAAMKTAEEFGVIDERAAQSLESAKRIFDTFKNIATNGFTFAGAVGVIGGVATLVNTMMSGDSDRKRLLRENNQRLSEVRDGLAEFRLEISGGDQQTLIDVLTEGLGDGPFTGSSQLPALLNWLNQSGFSEMRLDQIAKDLGINIRDSRGRIFYDGLVSLLTALMGTNQGSRANFGNDLSALEDSFSVNQTNIAGQVQQLGALGGRYSRLFDGIVNMNDLTGTRTRLRQMFADFQANRISLRDMGGMSRSQFQSFLTMLIGRLDQAIGQTAPPSGSTNAQDVPNTGSALVLGGSNVPEETVQDVIKAMDTNLGELLTTHTAIHQRIAVATEGSYTELKVMNGKMDALITATANQTSALDARFASLRSVSLLSNGVGPAF